MSITQSEYDYFMKQPKEFELLTPIKLGPAPLKWSRKVNAEGIKDAFALDFYRGSFELKKYTYNHRFRSCIVLFRYDASGRHTNPDDVVFEGPHIHLYRSGYADKWAFPIADAGIDENDSMEIVFEKILYFCNIKNNLSIITSMY